MGQQENTLFVKGLAAFNTAISGNSIKASYFLLKLGLYNIIMLRNYFNPPSVENDLLPFY